MGDTLPGGVLRARAIAVAVAQWRPDWLAGHVGFEPANPSASYLICLRTHWARGRPNPGGGERSRSSS